MLLWAVLLLCGLGCKKQDHRPPNLNLEEPPPVLEFQWISRLDPEEKLGNLAQGVLYKDWFVYPGDDNTPMKLMAFDKVTGEKAWEQVYEEHSYKITYALLAGDLYIARHAKFLFGIDLDTRAIQWAFDFGAINMRPGLMTLGSNGLVYLNALKGLHTDFHQEFLLEFDPLTGQSRTVIRYDPDSLGAKAIGPPVLTDGPDGRQVAIFNLAHFAYAPPQESPQEIRAIDLETGETIWSSPVIDSFPSNLLHPPVVFEDLVITGGGWSMYAFNKYTGEPVWTYAFDYPWGVWTKTNHLVHQDRLYVNNSQFDVTCLDPRSGELIWNNSKGGPNSCESMTYYEKEDLLVFSSWGYGSVMVLDALTGRTIHREKALEGASFYKDVLYDEELDMFFTASFKHAFGFTIQRPD